MIARLQQDSPVRTLRIFGAATVALLIVACPVIHVHNPLLRDAVTALDKALPDSRVFTLEGHGHEGQLTAPERLAA
jgi:hypothetical protein